VTVDPDTLALHEARLFEWRDFQERLAARIAARPERTEAYYDRWLEALEGLLGETSVLSPSEVAERAAAYQTGERDQVAG